jgi:DNA repair protein RadC
MTVAITYIVIMAGRVLIKDLDSKNKPRERLLEKGSESLSDIELLAIIIRSGGSGLSVMDLSANMLKKYQTLQNLFEADVNQLVKEKYVGPTKAVTIKAVAELAKRAYLTQNKSSRLINNPEDAFKVIKKDLFGKKQEYLYLISLDSRKNLISKDLICIGSINETLIPVREIIRKALIKDAVNVILAHNHPSNNPTPSHEDILVTEKVAKACILSGIALIDHIITAGNDYVSIKSLDLFESKKLLKERG